MRPVSTWRTHVVIVAKRLLLTYALIEDEPLFTSTNAFSVLSSTLHSTIPLIHTIMAITRSCSPILQSICHFFLSVSETSESVDSITAQTSIATVQIFAAEWTVKWPFNDDKLALELAKSACHCAQLLTAWQLTELFLALFAIALKYHSVDDARCVTWIGHLINLLLCVRIDVAIVGSPSSTSPVASDMISRIGAEWWIASKQATRNLFFFHHSFCERMNDTIRAIAH